MPDELLETLPIDARNDYLDYLRDSEGDWFRPVREDGGDWWLNPDVSYMLD